MAERLSRHKSCFQCIHGKRKCVPGYFSDAVCQRCKRLKLQCLPARCPSSRARDAPQGNSHSLLGIYSGPSGPPIPEGETMCSSCDEGQKARPRNQLIHTIPGTLGNFACDADSLFARIGAPTLLNMDNLFYWLGTKTSRSDWLGSNVPVIAKTLESQSPALVAVTSYMALKRLAVLTSTEADARYALKARSLTIREINSCTKVDGSLCVTVTNIALMSAGEGDLLATQTHLQALKRLRQFCNVTPYEWLLTSGTELRIASAFGWRPVLPLEVPPELILSTPFLLPIEIIDDAQRKAEINISDIKGLLGDDLDIVQQGLRGIHITFRADIRSEPDWAHLLQHGWYTSTFFGRCREETAVGNLVHPNEDSYEVLEKCTLKTSPRRLIAATLVLLSWRAATYHVPLEGVIQFRLLDHAREVWMTMVDKSSQISNSPSISGKAVDIAHQDAVRRAFECWSCIASFESLIWCLGTFLLESTVFLREDSAIWSHTLRMALVFWKESDQSLECFVEHVSRWPYATQWFEPIAIRIWQLCNMTTASDEEKELDEPLPQSHAVMALPLHSHQERDTHRGPIVRNPVLL